MRNPWKLVSVVLGIALVGVVALLVLERQQATTSAAPGERKVPDGKKDLDRQAIFDRVESHSGNMGIHVVVQRTGFEIRQARLLMGSRDGLNEKDMEFLARMKTEYQVDYVKRHGDYNDDKGPRDLSKEEIRAFFDKTMSELRAENEDWNRQIADDLKKDKRIDDALGGKGR